MPGKSGVGAGAAGDDVNVNKSGAASISKRLLLIAHFGSFSRTFGRMLQQLFQQPTVEIAFVDLLRVPVSGIQ